jgi:hypothetical protein
MGSSGVDTSNRAAQQLAPAGNTAPIVMKKAFACRVLFENKAEDHSGNPDFKDSAESRR